MKSPELNYGGMLMHFNYVWLRDHCLSASSYNSKTNQRNLDTGSIDLAIRPENTQVEEEHLVITCKWGTIIATLPDFLIIIIFFKDFVFFFLG